MNTIVWGIVDKRADLITTIENAEVNMMYSNVEGGWEGETNMDVNPNFVDEMHHLSEMSHCVDHGADSADFNGTWLHAPKKDMDGDDRPHPGSDVDIGADETPYFFGIFDNPTIRQSSLIKQVYPNPARTSVTFTLRLDKVMDVDLKVYNQFGEEVEVIFSGMLNTGENEITWLPQEIPSGVYFIQLITANHRETKRIVVLN
jgi:hypothetical protein